jgi:hypothetical protein
MKATRVEIVPARRAGVTGYANVGRGSLLGNLYIVGEHGDAQRCVNAFHQLFHMVPDYRKSALALLDREWPDGVVRLGCPCNGVEKGQPCHATVIKEFLEAEIARRG